MRDVERLSNKKETGARSETKRSVPILFSAVPAHIGMWSAVKTGSGVADQDNVNPYSMEIAIRCPCVAGSGISNIPAGQG